jgi:hypothetical protein
MRKKSYEQEVIEIQANYFLETLGMCQELHVLPKPGGLYDQDSMYVHLMKHALMAQHERRELDNRKAANKARPR